MKRRPASTRTRSGFAMLRAALALKTGKAQSLEQALSDALRAAGLTPSAFRKAFGRPPSKPRRKKPQR